MLPSLSTRIGQALLTEQFPLASELIEQLLAEASDVPFATQLRWFMALPEPMIIANPSLRPHAALVASYEQRFDLSQRWLAAGANTAPGSVTALGEVVMQLVLAGDLPTLAEVSARLVDVITESSALWSLAHGSLAGARYATGDPAGALTAIGASFRSFADTPQSLMDVQAAARPVAARLLLEMGRPSQANELLAESRAWLADAPAACSQLAPVLWADSMAALREGAVEAAGAWSIAPSSVSALGLPFFEVWMLLDFARVRTAVGDEAGARHALFRVQALLGKFRDPGAFRDRLDEVGAPYGVQALPRRDQDWSFRGVALSAREREVLALLDSDLSLREVADHLFITHNTIKVHLRSIYRKLGVSSRLAAVRAAAR